MNKFDKRIAKLPNDIFLIISDIDQLKGMWHGGMTLGTKTLNRLEKSALITSAGASTRIEGARMTDEEIRRLLDGLKITGINERDKEEVQGYLDAEKFIRENYDVINLTENHLKQIHKILLSHSHKDSSHRGNYKRMPNDVVARDASGREIGIVFRTLSPLETPAAMEELMNWISSAFSGGTTHPLLAIASFVVEFLRIHPFIDGNGRMSRIMTDLLMLKTGFSYTSYISMEQIIEQNKADYYLALRKSQSTFGSDDESIETWVRFFLDVCQKQATKAAELLTGDHITPILSQNQLAVYQIATELGEFAVRDIEERTDIPRSTIKQALEKLEAEGIITANGAGRGAYYRMTK